MKTNNEQLVKRPYLILLLIELALIVFIAGGSAYVQIAGLEHPAAPFIGFIPIALFLAFFFASKKRGQQFFLPGSLKLTPRQWLDFSPLLIILVLLLIANHGFDSELSASSIVYLLVTQLFLVGFVEESLFRGIMLRIFLHKGAGFAILISSFFFGVTHALQALGGQSAEDTILQIVYAFLIGLLLATLTVKHRTILPGIIFHGLHNFLNFTGNAPSTHLYDYLILALLAITVILLQLSGRNKTAAAVGV
ncbi:CPBP family intramembrane glutamic endopeptidase [Paenibacillus sp. NEAU-GSW1]|uniref:CPBP family intramembrane glutamic endopeptidase n=1 Tax=Paenibacillus sp. NEAU-GSW1 TaxID=2682486 RepID=UPI0012E31C1E|nr:CPBP family intramembrane glutamic endopeptidase [Paenibacillus sp. NEAU-GSW1]MUT65714.1 CPBP family intramembrane metalloprotease [Paenibacillus sp. NEAU-GSW1]